MSDKHDQPSPEDDPLRIPPEFDRRGRAEDHSEDVDEPQDPEETSNITEMPEEVETPQNGEAKLEDIADEYRSLDRRSIEGKIRQGELLEKAHRILTEYKAWVKFVTGPLATNLMDAHRKIRCFKAAKKVGDNKLLSSGLSESAIWYLAAPDVPEEALLEALELSKTEPVTAVKAEQIALKAIKAKKVQPPKRRSTGPQPEKVELEPTPEAIARYVGKTFTDEEIDRFIELMDELPPEKEDTRTNSAPMNRAVDWVRHAQAKKISSNLSAGLGACLVKDSYVYASDGEIFAAALFPHDGPFLAPGRALQQAVRGEPDIEIGNGELVFTYRDESNRRIPRLPTEEFPEFREPVGDRHTLKWEARTAIRTLEPFCSEDTSRPEAMGIWLKKGVAVVANGKIKLRVKGTGLKPTLFLPIALIKFILSQRAAPIELVLGDGWVWFIWADGSWAGMEQTEPSGDAKKILNGALAELRAMSEPNGELTDDWRNAFDEIKGTGAEHVLIYKDRLEGTYKSGIPREDEDAETCHITIPVKTPVPASLKDKYLEVPVRLIEPVLQVADAIDFTAYPDAVNFAGETVVGLVELPNTAGE
jgi:hypothetical protein